MMLVTVNERLHDFSCTNVGIFKAMHGKSYFKMLYYSQWYFLKILIRRALGTNTPIVWGGQATTTPMFSKMET